MVRGKGTYYLYDGAHKDRGIRMCVCVCVCMLDIPQYFNLFSRKKAEYKMGYKMVGVKKMITWVDLVSF